MSKDEFLEDLKEEYKWYQKSGKGYLDYELYTGSLHMLVTEYFGESP